MGHIREYLADAIIGFADQIILWKSLPNFSGRCSAVNPMKQATKNKNTPTLS
jgi:hypothetical protein